MAEKLLKVKGRTLSFVDNNDIERRLLGRLTVGLGTAGKLRVKGDYLYYIDNKGHTRKLIGRYVLAYHIFFTSARLTYQTSKYTLDPETDYPLMHDQEEADSAWYWEVIGQRFNVPAHWLDLHRGMLDCFDTSTIPATDILVKTSFKVRLGRYVGGYDIENWDYYYDLKGGSDLNALDPAGALNYYSKYLTYGTTFKSIWAANLPAPAEDFDYPFLLGYIDITNQTAILELHRKEAGGTPPEFNSDSVGEFVHTPSPYSTSPPRLIVWVRRPVDGSAGKLRVKGRQLRYFDFSGFERYLTAQGVVPNTIYFNRMAFNAAY